MFEAAPLLHRSESRGRRANTQFRVKLHVHVLCKCLMQRLNHFHVQKFQSRSSMNSEWTEDLGIRMASGAHVRDACWALGKHEFRMWLRSEKTDVEHKHNEKKKHIRGEARRT